MTKNGAPELRLRHANKIIFAALDHARATGALPLAVAVLDAGGSLMAFEREDGASLLRFDIAFAKSYGALGMGLGSRQLAVRAAANPNFYNSLYAISGGRLASTPGGVLIRDEGTSTIVGAVGISGDTSTKDEECAVVGIKAAGFVPDPGAAT